MVFCSHCGKSVGGGRFCSACGGPIAPDAVDAMTAKLKRYRTGLLLIVVALGLTFAVTTGLIVSRVMQAAHGSPQSGESSTPVTQPQQPLPAPPVAPQTLPGQPQPQPQQTLDPEVNNPAIRSSTSSIRPQDVQAPLTTLPPKESPRNPSPQHLPAPPVESTGSDRYPGSESLEVNANLPDIGVPVATEVYTTTDSLSTVTAYYTRRYPDAQLTEVSGQKIIAIDRPGVSKVIAIGTTGEETRISIVKQAN
jgi:hypothetical protein